MNDLERAGEIIVRHQRIIDSLTFREREILKLRSGAGDGYVYTRAEVAEIWQIKPTNVYSIQVRAIRKLIAAVAKETP